MSQQQLQDLLGQGDVFDKSWKELMFALPKVVALKAFIQDADTARALLDAGARYQGAGWCTSQASKALYMASGVAIVKPDFQHYKHAFLFAMAIVLEVEIPLLELDGKEAEAAYALVQALEDHPMPQASTQPKPQSQQGETEEEEEETHFG
jgi:hypothetical protein